MNIVYNSNKRRCCFLENKFDLDEILAERKNNKQSNKNAVNNPIANNKPPFNIQQQAEQNVENISDNKNFKVDIDFNNGDILIDDSLLYSDDALEDDNVIKNFFKKENRISLDLNRTTSNKKHIHEEENNLLDNNQIFEILKLNKEFLLKKTIVLLILFAISVCSLTFNLDLCFGIINIATIINLATITLATLSCSDIIINGLKSLIKKNSSFDSITALACFAAIIQSCFGLFDIYATKLTGLYAPTVVLILLFNILSKWFIHSNMKRNSRFMISQRNITEVGYCYFNNILNPEADKLSCTSVKNTRSPQLCYSNMSSEKFTNKLCIYLLLLLSFLISAINFSITKDVYISISTLCCMLVVASPLSTDFCSNFVINQISKKLYKNKSILYKYSAIYKLKECENLIIDNNEFFLEDNFKLLKMKIFDYNKINESIIDIASLLVKTESRLTKVFLDIIGNKTQLIKEVTNIEQTANLGYSGIIDNKKITFGTSDYLLDNNIVIPSKYIKLSGDMDNDKSLKTLYIAIDGLLTAMFLIKITPNQEMVKTIKNINKNDLKITCSLVDTFITIDNISYIYNINKNNLNTISPNEKSDIQFNNLGILYSGTTTNFVTSIANCIKIKHLLNVAYILQLVSIISGFCLIITFVALNAINLITFSGLIGIQLFWLFISFIISNIHR